MPQGYDPRQRNNSRPAAGSADRSRRMPSDDQLRSRRRSGNGGQPQQRQAPQHAPQGQQRQNQRTSQRQPQRTNLAPEQTVDYSSTVKGLIAVFLTLLIVIIIVMLFAKSLFVSGEELAKNLKTGHLTETEYVAIEAREELEEEVVTTKKEKKKTTTKEEKAEPAQLPEGLDTSVAGTYMVNDAVYLHPTPDSASENLATLPYGTEIEVFGSSNYGWYYVEYEGQYGYAWGTYFTPKT